MKRPPPPGSTTQEAGGIVGSVRYSAGNDPPITRYAWPSTLGVPPKIGLQVAVPVSSVRTVSPPAPACSAQRIVLVAEPPASGSSLYSMTPTFAIGWLSCVVTT